MLFYRFLAAVLAFAIVASANAYPTLDASGHLDDTRWDDDLLFEEGLNGILRTAARR